MPWETSEPGASLRAVMVLQERYRASERKVCRVVGQHCSTRRHPPKVVLIEEGKLRHRFREISAEHVRWGRRMAYRLLRREGWSVSHKPAGHNEKKYNKAENKA